MQRCTYICFLAWLEKSTENILFESFSIVIQLYTIPDSIKYQGAFLCPLKGRKIIIFKFQCIYV